MFIQVYFHRTRRYLDAMLVNYLSDSLPNGRYPIAVKEYLEWYDARIWGDIKRDESTNESVIIR